MFCYKNFAIDAPYVTTRTHLVLSASDSIAVESGFRNADHMGKVFRQRTGLKPINIRLQKRNVSIAKHSIHLFLRPYHHLFSRIHGHPMELRNGKCWNKNTRDGTGMPLFKKFALHCATDRRNTNRQSLAVKGFQHSNLPISAFVYHGTPGRMTTGLPESSATLTARPSLFSS